VIADEIAGSGGGKLIGNYGEYSGGPSREETYLYAREVIGLMLASVAKKKALVIAGGIANFTDIKSTFAGIIDALREVVPQLQKLNVKVFVRRGGPREAEGLAEMHTFLRDNKILGSTHGSGAPIILAAREALAYVS
jgi:succinyl-CoA synthetase beta subunit